MKPLILAIDTTGAYGSLALTRGAELIEEVALHAPDGFAHVLYGHIAGLLDRHGEALSAVDVFAGASGPGSFTGVRVGLACVKGLAEACRKPAFGISNLLALSTFGTAPLRAPVIDARRGEIYAAVYDANGHTVQPEVVCKLADWRRSVPAGAEFIVPEGFDGLEGTTAPRALAAAIAGLAVRRIAEGLDGDPAALDANYVRRSDAELFWKE